MEARLRGVEERLIASGAAARRGGDTDEWDLEVRTGSFATARLVGTVEEHGHGNQMLRWRAWPRPWPAAAVAVLLSVGVAILAIEDGSLSAAIVALVVGAILVLKGVLDGGRSVGQIRSDLGSRAAHER